MTDLDIVTYGFSMTSDQGGLGWSSVSLLKVADKNILVDTGPSGRRGLLVNALKAKGLTPDEIDTVILTHLHWDHCQNVDLFPDASILVHPKEIDYNKNPNTYDYNASYAVASMLETMKVTPISDGDKITEEITIIDTPGHTLGHLSVQVQIDEDRVLIAGDAMPAAATIERKLPYNVFFDVKQATESVERMVDSSNVFYPGHDRPFRLDQVNGGGVQYLHGPTQVEVFASNDGANIAPSMTYNGQSTRKPNIDLVQQ